MKIKDIPFPALRELAMEEQERQGNKRNEDLHIYNPSNFNNFDWDKSKLGEAFWQCVNIEDYEEAREIFDWDKMYDGIDKNKDIVQNSEQSDFDNIALAVSKLLNYKNKKYGNSALNPISIFNGKSKVGQRIDDKLSRIKNNEILQKNDIVDLLGYLILVCKENGWSSFDEFMD